MTLNEAIRDANVTWHGVLLNEPDWRPSSPRSVAALIEGVESRPAAGWTLDSAGSGRGMVGGTADVPVLEGG
jgi:hypothetical protein